MKGKALKSYISDSEDEYSLYDEEIDDKEENVRWGRNWGRK